METVAIIRQRNQLTIPEKARKKLSWLKAGIAVKIITSNDSLWIKPHYEENIDWDGIWKTFRSVVNKGRKISLSKFVIQDRLSH